MDNGIFCWRAKEVLDQDGVIVGCTNSQEWLLPWWWMHFRMHEDCPVTFIDFGNMSHEARTFCSKRGALVTLEISDRFITSIKDLGIEATTIWKSKGLDLEASRSAWFRKPFACLYSPYQRTLWIDLDCQVRKSIRPIFEFCENSWGISIKPEPPAIQQSDELKGILCYGETEYNTGVIAFKHGCSIIQEWAKICIDRSDAFCGDQEALSRMAFERDIELPNLLPIHNCRLKDEIDVRAAIIFHWLGIGKEYIKAQIEVMQNNCLMDFSL